MLLRIVRREPRRSSVVLLDSGDVIVAMLDIDHPPDTSRKGIARRARKAIRAARRVGGLLPVEHVD